MFTRRKKYYRLIVPLGFCFTVAAVGGCKLPASVSAPAERPMPATYNSNTDTTNISAIPWRSFFTDPNLVDLIDTALRNNQELMITFQEIEIARNEIRSRKAALLPTVQARAGAGVEKVGLYTSQGAGDASTDITPGQEVPEILPDYMIGLNATWEVDIWKKLHNAKKAAVARYLSTIEGKNFVLTNLVAEVANSYYELLALDNQLAIVKQNIRLQLDALDIVKAQKEAARSNELAVQKFNAEVLKSQSLEYDLTQQITETENRINFLLGRYPQPIPRSAASITEAVPAMVTTGIPSQLLENRPDIKQAELELTAAKLDVKVARAEFYPSLGISAGVGYQAFNPAYLFRSPESLLYSIAGDLAGPLINKNAIKAEYYMANARQLQAVYNYRKTILNAYIEVATQLSAISNLQKKLRPEIAAGSCAHKVYRHRQRPVQSRPRRLLRSPYDPARRPRSQTGTDRNTKEPHERRGECV